MGHSDLGPTCPAGLHDDLVSWTVQDSLQAMDKWSYALGFDCSFCSTTAQGLVYEFL